MSVTTKAWLDGDQIDLQTCAMLLPVGDVRVVKEAGKFYLSAPQLDSPTSGKAFHEVAKELARHINGIGRLIRSDFSPVKLTDRYDRDDGVRVVGPTANLVVRSQVSAVAGVLDTNGNPEPEQLPSAPSYIVLAANDPDVAEVLDILGQPGRANFADVYKILEIIEYPDAVSL
jgi:hypothetical protein